MRITILVIAIAHGLSAASLPVFFEPNVGQSHPSVQWIGTTGSGLLYVASNVAAIPVNGHPVRMRFVGGRESAKAEGIDRQHGISSYFHGNVPSRWQTGVQHYAKVRYSNVYSGI